MPEFLPAWVLSPQVAVVAQILAIAVAAGLSLYATVATLGLTSLLGLTPPLPPGASGLENSIVILTALLLLVLDALADRERLFVATWNAVHALIKAVAAALLCFSALSGPPLSTQGTIAAAAALVALLTHAFRYGLRVAARLPAPPTGGILPTLLETGLAAGLVVFALRLPEWAIFLALGLLLALLLLGWTPWRAFALGVAAQTGRVRAFLGETGWREARRLPRAVGRVLPGAAHGAAAPRAAPAAALDVPGVRRFRRGWLVVAEGVRLFVHRGWRGTRATPLPHDLELVGRAAWGDVVRLGSDPEVRLLLLRHGPGAERLDRTLRAVAPH